jgi:hypothetical protein
MDRILDKHLHPIIEQLKDLTAELEHPPLSSLGREIAKRLHTQRLQPFAEQLAEHCSNHSWDDFSPKELIRILSTKMVLMADHQARGYPAQVQSCIISATLCLADIWLQLQENITSAEKASSE